MVCGKKADQELCPLYNLLTFSNHDEQISIVSVVSPIISCQTLDLRLFSHVGVVFAPPT